MTSDRPFIVRIRIRDLRKEQSLTQEDLAEMLGVSRQSVIALESGKYMPSLPLAMQLAEVFSLPLERIFMSDDEPETANLPMAYPPVNVAITPTSLILEAAVIGYLEQEIVIDVATDTVTISGQPTAEGSTDRQYLAQELLVVPFRRTIHLPYQVDPDHSTATVKQGMLTITLPLQQQSIQKRRLTISES